MAASCRPVSCISLVGAFLSSCLLPCAGLAADTTSVRIGRRAALSGAGALVPVASWASGGATAGKTTSIPRAKTRYYSRITASVQEFEILKNLIVKNDVASIQPFFVGEESPYEGSPDPSPSAEPPNQADQSPHSAHAAAQSSKERASSWLLRSRSTPRSLRTK